MPETTARLMVFLAHKPAPIGIQHHEHALRPIPMRAKVWRVGWKELDA
jgi:hypothetical protein